MKITDLIPVLNLTVVAGNGGLNNEITGGYVSDLLSDVIGNIKEGNVWITIQTHQNIIAVASLKDVACIILTKGASAEEETKTKSNELNIPVLVTDYDSFTISGRLYNLLKRNE